MGFAWLDVQWVTTIGLGVAWLYREFRHWRLRNASVYADVVAKLLENQTRLQETVNKMQADNLRLHDEVNKLRAALTANGIDPDGGIRDVD